MLKIIISIVVLAVGIIGVILVQSEPKKYFFGKTDDKAKVGGTTVYTALIVIGTLAVMVNSILILIDDHLADSHDSDVDTEQTSNENTDYKLDVEDEIDNNESDFVSEYDEDDSDNESSEEVKENSDNESEDSDEADYEGERKEPEKKGSNETDSGDESSMMGGEPSITNDVEELTYALINEYQEVIDSDIDVSDMDEEITLAVIVTESTTDEDAKELGDNFVRGLASMTASKYDDLEGPEQHDLGELYDYYDVHVGVGTSPENIQVQGYKVKGADEITW